MKATIIPRGPAATDVEDSLENQLGFRIVGEGSSRLVRVFGLAKGRVLARPALPGEIALWDALVKARRALMPRVKGKIGFQAEGFLTGYMVNDELHIRETFHEKYLDAIKESDIEDLNPIRVMVIGVTEVP